MDIKNFKLPPSLEGKVFRADHFFEEKSSRSSDDFILKNLTHSERIAADDGAFVLRRICLPLDTGRCPEGYSLAGSVQEQHLKADALAALAGAPEWETSENPRLLFLDLETTGLAGGTGTFPFLCGIGYFEKGCFIIEQFFMEDYPQEAFMLRHLAERIKAADALVSFNGKTFDVPLLSTRFIYNRMRVNLDLPHIDLLHPSRRLWKGSLPDCRLETIEHERFGIRRARDVESSLIPTIYFNYVRGHHQEWILPVFDHNAQDIATLGALLIFFCRLISGETEEGLKQPLELWGLGRLFLKMSRMEQAASCLCRALNICDDMALLPHLLIHAGMLYKRMGRYEQALQAWESLLQTSSPQRIIGAIEIAKYYEHRAGNPQRAREAILHVVQGMSGSDELSSYLQGFSSGTQIEITPEIEKRLRRLEKKMGLLDDDGVA